MALQFKRRLSGSPGAPSSLLSGQPAWNAVDQILYLGDGDNGSGVATAIRAIGGPGFVVDRSTAQTIGGVKTFSSAPKSSVAAAANDDLVRLGELAGIVGDTAIATAASQDITLGGTVDAVTAVLATVNSNVGTFTKVTVNAKGLVTAASNLTAADIPTLTAAKISDFDTQVRTSRLDQMAAPTAAVSMNSQRITGLADPTSAQDAATKAYVDAAVQGLDPKASVRVATTGNITLSGTQTIDGVAVIAGDRVLVKDQTTASQNGIYTVAAGAWTRATDADAWTELVSAFTFVESGTTNADSGWVSTADPGGTLGTTSVTWTQFSGAGQVEAGAGLTKTGNTLDVVGTAGRIVVNADSIDLASGIVTPGTYLSQTVDTYGRTTGGSNPANLAALRDATTAAADTIVYWTSATVAAFTTLTAFARTVLDDTTDSAMRTTLGLGTMATQNANNVAITGGSWTTAGSISSAVTIDDGTF